mgnify:CR=1 FL=1
MSISNSLAKKALAAKVDGELYDLTRPLDGDADLALITAKDPEGLELIRHDAAHVLAQAVQELFPGTQVTIGPVIDDGFYYDFAREEPFTPEDLGSIEAEMQNIINARDPVRTQVWERPRAVAHLAASGEPYTVDCIDAFPGDVPLRRYCLAYSHNLLRGPS